MTRYSLCILMILSCFNVSFCQTTYQWFKDGVEIKGATNEKYNPQFSGNYSVRITNQNNCTSEVSLPIAFKCFADKPIVLIESNFKISSNVDANTYSWYLDNVLLPENTKTIKIKKAGKYSLKIINFNGCDSEMSDYVTMIFVDSDNDGIEDSEDNCPKIANSSQKDSDKDGIGDVCDDSDEDGIMDDKDQCQNTIKGNSVDLNGCADYQKDTDGDGIMDDKDLCSNTIKGSKVDTSGCADYQKDTDGDGIMDDKDQCQNTIKGNSVDLNGCADYQKDTDGDGIMDDKDLCSNTIKGSKVDTSGCADYQKDTDGDGIMDDKDLCSNTIKGSKVDTSGCADYQKDTDGDGIMDDKDDCPTIKNPVSPSILKINDIELKTLNPNPGDTYQWFFEGVSIIGGNLATLKVITPGNYSVQIKDKNGCKSPISSNITILILGTEEVAIKANAFPNPFNSTIKITFEKEFGELVSVSIFDMKGSIIFTKNAVQFNETLDLSKLIEGTYLLKIESISNENRVYLKLLKY